MLLGLSDGYASYVICYVMFYSAIILFSIFFRSERAKVIPKDLLGRTIGVIIFITFLLFPLSGLLISFSQNLFGLRNLIMFFGGFCLLLGFPLLKNIYQYEFGTKLGNKEPIVS
jgi:hypothetical protein